MADDAGRKTELRKEAQARMQGKKVAAPPPATEEQVPRLVHELEVHQIELEIQNEELRQTRDTLETTLEKYTDLYDFAPIGYLTLDRNGGITEANLAITTLLDMARSRLIGKRFGLFIAPEACASFTTFLETAIASQTTKSWEGRLLSARSLPLFVRIEALADGSGQTCRAAIIDMSIPRQLQEELALAHIELGNHVTQLSASNAQLEAFTYTISHDLKTPLVTIIGFVGQLKQDLECNDQVSIQADFDFISKAAHKMRDMLDDLLQLSRSGRAVIDPQQLDLSTLVRNSVALLGSQLAHVKLEIKIPPDLPVLYGDPIRLGHVLLNLLGNAAKFTRRVVHARIEVGCKADDDVVTCSVRDNGIGIAPEYHDLVFKLFEKLNLAEEGTGIGLAIVRRIIEEHDGQVWVESTGAGQGSSFFFTLPIGSLTQRSTSAEEQA